MSEMTLTKGFQIDEPNVFIPWDIDENGLTILFEKYDLKKICDGYYCVSCKSLGGLNHELGFHFVPKRDDKKEKEFEDYIKSIGTNIRKIGTAYDPHKVGKLWELEFFRKAYPDLRKSFDEFQCFFEKAFGQPSNSKNCENGFCYHEWRFRGIRVFHHVLDRFGPEEHLRIRILGSNRRRWFSNFFPWWR